MSEKKRYYRKNLTSQGLIYIADQELEISIRNSSITGLLAELSDNPCLKSMQELFEALKKSPTVDLYLPEMRMVGDAEVVRADLVENHIYIALEFTHLSYDVDNVLYKRKAYRKDLEDKGQIIFSGKKYPFTTRNVSVNGLMIHLEQRLDVKPDTLTIFDFKRLKLRGEIKVVWVEDAEDGGTLMGLEYVHMEKEQAHIKGVPKFEH